MAPAYDLPSTAPYRDLTFALSMGSRVRGMSRRHFLSFATTIGLPERAAVNALDDVIERTAFVDEQLRSGALPFDQQTTADLVAELLHRRRALSIR